METIVYSETRNICDHYHYWTTDAIKADLDSKRNNFTIIASNLENDFNIATVIRNANAFLASEVWVYGKKQYDRRGTVGTHNYTNFKYVRGINNVYDELRSLKESREIVIVGMDNVPDAVRINDYEWPKTTHVVMVFGQEKNGIPQELLDICNDVVYIPQYGSVRSLNVGTAAGIAMYDYCNKTLK